MQPYPVYQPPPRPVSLPVDETEYHHFWRTPAFAIWRPLVAVLVGGGLWLVASVLGGLPMAFDLAAGQLRAQEQAEGWIQLTPWSLLGLNLSLAALIPIAIGCQLWFFGQRPGWLHSVAGRLRWRWLFFCLVPVLPLWLACILLEGLASGAEGGASSGPSSRWLLYLVIVLVTQPLQCAGEEYAFRGLVNRAVASFFRSSRAGLVAGALVSSALFAAAHASSDLWANGFYFGFGLVACALVWRTGGLEASIVMHTVNNLISFLALVYSGEIDKPIQLSNVSGGPAMLVPVLAGVIVLLILNACRARGGIQVTAAPGRELIAGLPSMQPPQPPFQQQPGQQPPFQQQPGQRPPFQQQPGQRPPGQWPPGSG